MQSSVYDACAKVGRRRSALSPELLKSTCCKEEPVDCPGISRGETEYLLSTTEKENLWQSVAKRTVQMEASFLLSLPRANNRTCKSRLGQGNSSSRQNKVLFLMQCT